MPRLAEVVRAIWWESASIRSCLHRVCRVRACDLRVVAGGVEIGAGRASGFAPRPRAFTRLSVSGECPCRDYLLDLVAEADRFLVAHGDGLVNLPGAVREHLRKRGFGDWTRRRRTEMGAQARTDRIRGSVRARGLPDEFHRALLEFVVDEAGSLAPLEDDAQLYRRLAERAAAEFGGDPEDYRNRVIGGLGVVEAACRQGRRVTAGPGHANEMITWWERYVERPLGRRPRFGVESLSAPPADTGRLHGPQIVCPVAEAELDRVLDAVAGPTAPAGGTEDDAVVLAVLADAVLAAIERSVDPVGAVHAATAELVRRRALPERIAERFVADAGRVQEAVRELLVMAVAA